MKNKIDITEELWELYLSPDTPEAYRSVLIRARSEILSERESHQRAIDALHREIWGPDVY